MTSYGYGTVALPEEKSDEWLSHFSCKRARKRKVLNVHLR